MIYWAMMIGIYAGCVDGNVNCYTPRKEIFRYFSTEKHCREELKYRIQFLIQNYPAPVDRVTGKCVRHEIPISE